MPGAEGGSLTPWHTDDPELGWRAPLELTLPVQEPRGSLNPEASGGWTVQGAGDHQDTQAGGGLADPRRGPSGASSRPHH